MTSSQIGKQAAGRKACELIRDGMQVGLGTGSTAAFFIEELGMRCREGLQIKAFATSFKSEQLAKKHGIPFMEPKELVRLDIIVDGADEVDPENRLIKGGGGALMREKILASISKQMVVIVDESKQVEALGAFPLPVEIAPFASQGIVHNINARGYSGQMRKDEEGGLLMTDNHNYIYDIRLPSPTRNPEEINETIRSIPGVLETGFFFNLASDVIVGYPDGHAEIRQ